MSSRPELAHIVSVRGHAARGTILNSAFLVGLGVLALTQQLVAAAFMSAAEFGLWAVILTLIVNVGWLKDVGVVDKYLQQSEADQELAFQKAFTLELYASLALLALIALVLPLWAVAFGRDEIILGGLLTALVLPINALHAPAWVPYRQLRYGRHRLLTGIPVVVGFVLTISLAVAGAGYWSFVAGALAGSVAGAVACVAVAPYPLRLRFDRATARAYVSFSWPLVAAGASGLVFVQGSLLVVNDTVGLAGVGAVGIVIGVVAFAERVDTVVGQTLYPAICAVADRRALLEEIFLKSNRIALMWAIPFSVGVALFAGDLITFVLGERWRSAEDLLIVVGLSVGFGHIAFNWIMFFRALDRTRPILVATLTHTVVFLAVLLPATERYGLIGYGIAFAVSSVVEVAQRAYYVRGLFDGFAVVRHSARAVAPVVPAALVVVAVRALADGPPTLARALAELGLFVVVTVAATLLLERRLISELAGYLRPGRLRQGVTA